jgi:hypothetical protein
MLRRALALLFLCVGCAHQTPVSEPAEFNANQIPAMTCNTFKNQLTQERADFEYLECTTGQFAQKVCDLYNPGYNMACSEILGQFCLVRVKMFMLDRQAQYEYCITQSDNR